MPRNPWLVVTCPTDKERLRVPLGTVALDLDPAVVYVPCDRCGLRHRFPLDVNSLDLLIGGGFDVFPDHAIPRPKASS